MLAPGGVVYQDDLWRLEHLLEPVPLAGWLVLKPLRHVTSFADLTTPEAAAFGPLVHRVTQALTQVVRPAKVYVCLFAEMEGFAHIHFHLIPRGHDVPPEARGPGIFKWLARAGVEGNLVDPNEAASIAIRVAALLRTDHPT